MEKTKSAILKDRARKASENSHSPYSGYAVGAAVETADGEIFSGCNVESSSYGLSICAERNAIFAAVANGHRKFKALAVYSSNGATPCGACRQIIWDICGEIPVYMISDSDDEKMLLSSQLLPEPFDDTKLGI